jgi:hypothetical protein
MYAFKSQLTKPIPMYKTDFVCTYKAFEKIEDDEVNSGMLYQAQFLQVFGLIEYTDAAINAGLELIKAKMAEVPELKALIMQHPYNGKLGPDDADEAENVLLPLMFAYPLMDVFHLCLIDAFKTGRISPEHQDKLLHAYSILY